ncbi:kinesin-like protein KIF20A isoform X2 [Ambystoma mexicanum]|uniref:kinesin-like protein KIF20A isoform X2 n=1 Tax=Ambystoma mexicanum TaxID=8296 RepID=UPI0037E941A5
MANDILSPNQGLFSDEDEAAIFESTGADFVTGIRKDLLSDFSVISPGLGAPVQVAEASQVFPDDKSKKVKVFLRIRPFKEVELERRENQACVSIEDVESLLLRAPKDSMTMKNSERGIGQGVQRFTFSQIFGPDVDQKQFFEGTMKQVVKEALNGQNWLVYTYGVTNSGKTYTIQGNSKDGGILPRSLSLIFSSIQDRLHKGTDLKPCLSSEVVWLDSRQVRQEELKKAALLSNLREEELFTPLKRSLGTEPPPGTSTSFDSGVAGLSSTSHFATQTTSLLEDSSSRWVYSDAVSIQDPDETQFSIWVSFFEIYNEFIYDLLDSGPSNGKRQSLRLCEDKNGNPYVKDLNWINVCDADEAWRILRVGRKNQSFASTHLNQSSSRSHSIFSIRILHLQGRADMVPKISELSLCDLAGSERCKDQRNGDRMKEASNINTSLHTLGRCIAALRQNQQQKLKQNIVPFRDSKLTRLFQAFFTGRGQSCMIVNINQCASTYDETLHALKFSAIASQLVQAPAMKLKIPSIKSLIREHSRANRSLEMEDDKEEVEEEDMDSDESSNELDVTMFDREDLMQAVEAIKDLLLKERQEKMEMEMRLRKEICDEMVEQMQEKEAMSSEYLEREKELLEEMYENRLENLQESFTKYYQQELKERDEKIEELEVALQTRSVPKALPPITKPQVTVLGQEEESLRRSDRVASSKTLQQELIQVKQELLDTRTELAQCHTQLRGKCKDVERYEKQREPLPSPSRCFAADVDRKLEEGQKNVRLLRSELQKLGDLLQSAERSCCHNTSARKLRLTLNTCEDILAKQAQSLAELQNNMILVKMDLKRKAACIAEQYNTVHKLQEMSSLKRQCTNAENMTPNQPPGKKPLLSKFLPRTPAWQNVSESPYGRILRSRQTPGLKTVAFGTKY